MKISGKNLVNLRMPVRFESFAQRFALLLSGGNNACAKAGDQHEKVGRAILFASILFALWAFKIDGLCGVFVLLVSVILGWSIFCLGQDSLVAQKKSEIRLNSFYEISDLLSFSIRQAFRFICSKFKFAIKLSFSRVFIAREILFSALGGISHISLTPRLSPIPVVLR